MTRAPDAAATSRPGWPRLVAAGVRAFYLAAVLSMLLWTAGAVAVGLDPVMITSGSMQPGVRPGDIVFVAATTPQRLTPGRVVTFVDPADSERLITHRIEKVLDDGRLRTHGDANPTPDSTPVTTDAVVGEGRLLVSMAGLPVLWARQGDAGRLALWALVTLAVLLAPAGDRPGRAGPADPIVRRQRPARPRPRRAARGGLARSAVVVATAAALVLPAIPAEAWSAASTNAGNSWSASVVPAPTGLVATGRCALVIVGKEIVLTWTPAPGISGQRIRKATSAGGPYVVLATAGASTSTYPDGTNVGGTRYYLIESFSGSWTSAPSNVASAKPPILCL